VADLYEVLQVSREATQEEIKKSYRRLAREWHPDANPEDPEAEARFKELAAAYEVLSDPEKRQRYDRFGNSADFNLSDPFGSGMGGLGDLFDSFFGGSSPFGGGAARGGRGPAGPPRGEDLDAQAVLEFTDAVFGCQTDVSVRTAVACGDCEATGASPGTEATRCSDCGGSGEVRVVRQTVLGQMVSASVCRTCGGQGEVIASPCQTCSGAGRVIEDTTYTVDVPAGVDEGSTLRLTGRGAVGMRGGPPGDLYVRLRVRPHERFERHGDDLVHELPISMAQAALGAHLMLETLDGFEDLVIPRGTQSGKVFKLKHRGVPRLDGRGRGDLLVQVRVDIPTTLDEESEDLLRRFATVRGEDVAPAEEGFFSRFKTAFKG
jgi:molecular chaperone DnaJ